MQSSVSSVVWPWREREAAKAIPRKTGPKVPAVLLQAAVMGAIGAGLYGWLEHRTMGIVVWSFASIILLSGLFYPPVFAAIERFGKAFGQLVGAILTWGLLGPIYFLCFFPAHLALKLKGKDPLHRRLHTDEPTYWTPRKPVTDPAQYRKQF